MSKRLTKIRSPRALISFDPSEPPGPWPMLLILCFVYFNP